MTEWIVVVKTCMIYQLSRPVFPCSDVLSAEIQTRLVVRIPSIGLLDAL